MPHLPRSTSLTFALGFGFLSFLTIFGVSSGGLKADTPVVSAHVASTHTPFESVDRWNLGLRRETVSGVRGYYPPVVVAQYRKSEIDLCFARCINSKGMPLCLDRRISDDSPSCRAAIRECRNRCNR